MSRIAEYQRQIDALKPQVDEVEKIAKGSVDARSLSKPELDGLLKAIKRSIELRDLMRQEYGGRDDKGHAERRVNETAWELKFKEKLAAIAAEQGKAEIDARIAAREAAKGKPSALPKHVSWATRK